MTGDSRLWLVRHAPVLGPRGVIHGDDAPADLSDMAIAAAVRAALPRAARAVASPARRAQETARRLIGDGFKIEPLLREQDFGAWTGQRHDDLQQEQGEAYCRFWERPALNRPPGGESFADQIARCREGLTLMNGDSDCIVVVHSGTIRALLAIALDLAPDAALRFQIDPWSVTRLDRIAGGWRVGPVNWTPQPAPAARDRDY